MLALATLVDCKEPIAQAAVDPDGTVLVVANPATERGAGSPRVP